MYLNFHLMKNSLEYNKIDKIKKKIGWTSALTFNPCIDIITKLQKK